MQRGVRGLQEEGGVTMEFKSQICTTVEQSKRLLELGLKKETADCMYSVMTKSYNGQYILEDDRQYNLCLFHQEEVQSVGFSHYEHIPAWSLHRLIELVDGNICIDDFAIEWAYDTVIDHIAFDIRHEQFNHEYLEEKL